jgi:hypothetical protein
MNSATLFLNLSAFSSTRPTDAWFVMRACRRSPQRNRCSLQQQPPSRGILRTTEPTFSTLLAETGRFDTCHTPVGPGRMTGSVHAAGKENA